MFYFEKLVPKHIEMFLINLNYGKKGKGIARDYREVTTFSCLIHMMCQESY
jgi:hypothetical protein